MAMSDDKVIMLCETCRDNVSFDIMSRGFIAKVSLCKDCLARALETVKASDKGEDIYHE